VQVSDCTPQRTLVTSAVYRALDYAARMGAHIVSMSLGAGFTPNQQIREQARWVSSSPNTPISWSTAAQKMWYACRVSCLGGR
jgi:hypothetical protein